MRRRVGAVLLVLSGLAVAAVALLLAEPSGAIDWRRLRAVALESDDWGLAGFVPAVGAWDGLRREDLSPGRFPEVYWHSTLEDSAAVAELAAVLGEGRGRDGRPAVLQPNYVVSSLAWEDGRWIRRDLPDLPDAYRRPGLWRAVDEAIAAGVWYPEYHAVWHYDPERRRRAVADGGVAATAAERGIMLFPGSEDARELGPWRSTDELASELDDGLAVFSRQFGRRPGALIAPDYTWDGRCESLWASRGVRVIQAKREQRHPGLPPGPAGRVLKVLERQWARARHPDRTYLERNCRLEPVQAPDAEAIVAACLAQTERAWRRGEPEVVETHRVNFAHGEPAIAEAGRRALASYLNGLAELGGPAPVFLVDTEMASLARRGTSAIAAGDVLVLRNGSHSRRLALAPANLATPRTVQGRVTLYLLDPAFQGAHGRVPGS